ncbi:phosphatidylinositol n-acetylglucosaminyltransferase subunit h [Anaeramoeba ignava]|uniref:Phosphatidylinositol n-acetylglucosaminyltransferase subunit h n=1 Tax=Anaeramoeba ignava TaxID=1746090 RepID=A0A9Q0LT29_ANAIG|nr:phosphatidylinositol n-acetylglucosaminyltransferase subunit h [Anaeramoeba ignava]
MVLTFSEKRINDGIIKFSIYTNAKYIRLVDKILFYTIIFFITITTSLRQEFSITKFAWVLIGLLIIHLFTNFFQVRSESLWIIPELGIQFNKKYLSGSKTKKFYDKDRMKNVIINEGITRFQIIFYIGFIIEGEHKLVMPFTHLYPKLKDLKRIYNQVQDIFFSESKSKDSGEQNLQNDDNDNDNDSDNDSDSDNDNKGDDSENLESQSDDDNSLKLN